MTDSDLMVCSYCFGGKAEVTVGDIRATVAALCARDPKGAAMTRTQFEAKLATAERVIVAAALAELDRIEALTPV
jgi:hypothetical protein